MKNLNFRMVHSVEFYGFVLCALLFASYYTITRIDNRETWLKHSNEVLMHSTTIQLQTAESELFARNFSLTGKPIFEAKFDSVSKAAVRQVMYLKELTADNPTLQPALDSVKLNLLERISFHKNVINVRKSQGIDAAVKLVQKDREAAYSTKFDRYITEIDESEQRLMNKRKSQSARASMFANVSFMTTAVFVFLLITVMMRRRRREAENLALLHRELLANSERMKQAENLASLGVWSVNLKNGSIHGSDELYRIWGYEPGKDHSSTLDNYMKKVHPEDYKFVRTKMMGLTDQQGDDDYTFRLVEDGHMKTVSTGTAVIRDADHKLVSITGYTQDITEKTSAAKDLASANKELSILFNRIGEVLFSRDVRRDNYIQISDTCLQLYGYTADEFMDDQDLWLNIIHPADRKLVTDGNDVLSEGKNVTNQYRVNKRDGSERWLESTMVPEMDDDNHLIRIAGVTRDITDTKLQAIERTRMVNDLIQRNKTLEEFTYIISHSLRTPVANIVGLGAVFETLDADSTQKLEIQNEIVLCVKNLDTMIRDLNMVLQVREKVSEQKKMVYFKDLLKDVIATLPLVQNHENIDIIGYFDGADSYYTIHSYISNIFFNLILNSVNYRRDNVKTSIHITSAISNNTIELTFKDNGKGIDLVKNQANLFGLYRKFDNSVIGKGMGLFMVKTQIELLGGTISVESELNSGTSFIVRLPL